MNIDDWRLAENPPKHSRVVAVRFHDDWAANYGKAEGLAYWDPNFLEWSLEGVKEWREIKD